jgi:hypothetical protein
MTVATANPAETKIRSERPEIPHLAENQDTQNCVQKRSTAAYTLFSVSVTSSLRSLQPDSTYIHGTYITYKISLQSL